MLLDQITPIVLTRNEAPNIGRTLQRLTWAKDIVVVDSYSDDETVNVVSQFAGARVIRREFDTHAQQWNFALNHTGISSESILALDADYVLSNALVHEIASLEPSAETSGYRVRFAYMVFGRKLRGSMYPPLTLLYRRRS